MFVEAIRAHLVGLGIEEAAEWSHGQLMHHVDEALLEQVQTSPERLDAVLAELYDGIRANVLAVNEVLTEDLQS